MFSVESLKDKIRDASQLNKIRFSRCKVYNVQISFQRLANWRPVSCSSLRWSGRNHREKIGVHVSFDQILNMEPYCCREPFSTPSSPSSAGSPRPKHFLYDLSAVVMHHGKGFGSGHYTSYCYNTEGGEYRGLTWSSLSMIWFPFIQTDVLFLLLVLQLTVTFSRSSLFSPSRLLGSL